MNKKTPVNFESLEDLEEYIRGFSRRTDEFERIYNTNPIVRQMLNGGFSWKEIVVVLVKENERLQHEYCKLIEIQGATPLYSKGF